MPRYHSSCPSYIKGHSAVSNNTPHCNGWAPLPLTRLRRQCSEGIWLQSFLAALHQTAALWEFSEEGFVFVNASSAILRACFLFVKVFFSQANPKGVCRMQKASIRIFALALGRRWHLLLNKAIRAALFSAESGPIRAKPRQPASLRARQCAAGKPLRTGRTPRSLKPSLGRAASY